MVVLDKATDLTVPPPNWAVAGALAARGAGGRAHQQLITYGPADSDAAAMTDALAALAGLGPEATDFVASSSTMKTIFGLAYSNASVQVAVNRVDNTLVLNGVINGGACLGSRDAPLPHSSSAAQPEESGAISPSHISGDGDFAQPGEGDEKKHKVRKKKKKKRGMDGLLRDAHVDQLSLLYSKFMYYSASAPDDPAEPALEKDIREGLVQEALPDSRQDAGHGVQGTQEGGVQVFRRAVHFEFHNLNLLLGSDTVIFNRGVHTSELNLQLHDMDSEVPKLTCLDYWLDNIFNQVPHTAVCYHKEGKVHGYQLVRTQDIPTWSGFAFEPKAVMETASSILHFLQTNCTKDAGTYWLCRQAGSDEIQLYCLDDVDNRQRNALSQPIGLLCFKIARRLQLQDRLACAAGGSCKQRGRTARLFCNALAVLDDAVHPNVVSLAHEGLADAMVGAESWWAAAKTDPMDACGDSAEREAQFYVDENGDLQDAKPAAGNVDEDDTARPSVGDTALWGAIYSLADLENAESHYMEAARVRGLPLSAEASVSSTSFDFGAHTGKTSVEEEDVMRGIVSRRLRCKAAKCAIAIGIRLLRKGAVADALIKAVNAFDCCVAGQSREEQEIVSEAMEVWADVHVALAALTREQVLKVRADINDILEQERFLSSGAFQFDVSAGGAVDSDVANDATKKARNDMTPLSHPLSPDIEDNCNHAMRYFIRSLQVCTISECCSQTRQLYGTKETRPVKQTHETIKKYSLWSGYD